MRAGARRELSAISVWILAGCLLSPPAARAAPPAGAEEGFTRGNRFYQEGDFAAAAQAYESVLRLGVTSPELEFNLGNAYLKAEAIGPAVLHYRRALRINPTYESALININYARSLTQDVKPEERSESRLAWIGKLRLGPSTAAALLFFTFTGFVALAGFRLRVWRERAWAAVLQGVLGAIVLLLGGALLFEWSVLEGKEEGVVMVSEVEVRAGPGDTYTVSFRLHEGTEVEVLRHSSGWQEVKVSDRLQGWVPEDTVSEI